MRLHSHMLGRLLSIVPRDSVLPILTGYNRGFKWVKGAANCPEWIGIYEQENQEYLSKLVLEGMTVFDIGANVGFFTLLFSRLVGPQGKVFSFEPSAQNATHLLNHLRLNNARNVTVLQAGLGRVASIVPFDTGPNNFEGKFTETKSTNYLIPIFALDDLLDSKIIAPPDLMKIDIEGGEYELLRGATRLLEARRVTLFLSMHGPDQREKCVSFLKEKNYEISFVENGQKLSFDAIVKPPDANFKKT